MPTTCGLADNKFEVSNHTSRACSCSIVLEPFASRPLAPSWIMGGKVSAPLMARRRGKDEFFFDKFRQQWRWHWGGSWWTFEPLLDDDLELGLLRKGACWVSDQGHIWHGVDPEEWQRLQRRKQARRWWLREEHSRCKCTAMSLRRTSVPATLAKAILGFTFGDDIIKNAIR